jgi:peptidoglycan/LPS O-acetylase OafA/YrhL
MNLAKILPMAFVMIAGPQILSAIFLATSDGWRRNSVAYISGAALSITAIISASYFFINGISDEGSPSDTIDIVVLALLVLAGIHTYLKRAESQPPKWMGKLQDADAKWVVSEFVIGLFVVLTLNDILG